MIAGLWLAFRPDTYQMQIRFATHVLCPTELLLTNIQMMCQWDSCNFPCFKGTQQLYCINDSSLLRQNHNRPATYYLRDRFEPFCPEVELAGAVVLAPVLAWLLTSSLLLGFVSDSPGGSFRFSVKQKAASRASHINIVPHSLTHSLTTWCRILFGK
jgi:hypothetical protein